VSNAAPFQALAAALRERIAVIADREFYERDPAAHLEKLKDVSERIQVLGLALPKPVAPDLEHYLHRASFAKALAWLEEHYPTA
jgi:hypothetical protein